MRRTGIQVTDSTGRTEQAAHWVTDSSLALDRDSNGRPLIKATGSGASHTIGSHQDADFTGLATGALIYRDAGGDWVDLPIQGAGPPANYLKGGTVPAWGTIAVADLPTVTVAKGGTGLTTVAQGDILYASAADTIAALSIDTGVSVGDVLTVASGSTIEWAAPIAAAHDILSSTHDATPDTEVAGDLLRRNSGNSAWERFAVGTTSQVLIGGTVPAWDDQLELGVVTKGPVDPGVREGQLWWDTNTGEDVLKRYTGAAWEDVPAVPASHNLLDATYHDTTTGSEATGDVIYRNASSQWTRLAIGSLTYVLKVAGSPALPSWGEVQWSELGGSMPSNIALTDAANIFSEDQEIQKSAPRLILDATSTTGGAVRFEESGTARGRLRYSNANNWLALATVNSSNVLTNRLQIGGEVDSPTITMPNIASLSWGGGTAITSSSDVFTFPVGNNTWLTWDDSGSSQINVLKVDASNDTVLNADSGDQILFQVGEVTQGWFATDGDLVVGTTDPAGNAKLRVNPTFQVGDTDDYLITTIASGHTRIIFGASDSATAAIWNRDTGQGAKDFYWGETGDSGDYVFRGTGAASFGGSLAWGTGSPITSSDDVFSIPVSNNTWLTWDDSGSSQINVIKVDASDDTVLNADTGDQLLFQIGEVTQAWFASDGDFIVGTSDPAASSSAKLRVNYSVWIGDADDYFTTTISSGYTRIIFGASDSATAAIWNRDTGQGAKDFYWGEAGDSGNYTFRGSGATSFGGTLEWGSGGAINDSGDVVTFTGTKDSGDVLYWGGSAWTDVAIGTTGQVLTVQTGGTIDWDDPTTGSHGLEFHSDVNSSMSESQYDVLYWTGSQWSNSADYARLSAANSWTAATGSAGGDIAIYEGPASAQLRFTYDISLNQWQWLASTEGGVEDGSPSLYIDADNAALGGQGSGLTNLDAGNISAGTLAIARGGTNATSYTQDQFLIYNGTAITASGYDQTDFTTYNGTPSSGYLQRYDGTGLSDSVLSDDGTDLAVDTSGKVTMGSWTGDHIYLYGSAAGSYGFGIETNELRSFAGTSSSHHSWGYYASGPAYTEWMQLSFANGLRWGSGTPTWLSSSSDVWTGTKNITDLNDVYSSMSPSGDHVLYYDGGNSRWDSQAGVWLDAANTFTLAQNIQFGTSSSPALGFQVQQSATTGSSQNYPANYIRSTAHYWDGLGDDTSHTDLWTTVTDTGSGAASFWISVQGDNTKTWEFRTSGVTVLPAALDEVYGGTGQTTYTTGDLLYASGSDTLAKLAASTGSTGDVLTLGTGDAISWETPTTGATTLDELTDVTISGAAEGDALVRGTSVWQNDPTPTWRNTHTWLQDEDAVGIFLDWDTDYADLWVSPGLTYNSPVMRFRGYYDDDTTGAPHAADLWEIGLKVPEADTDSYLLVKRGAGSGFTWTPHGNTSLVIDTEQSANYFTICSDGTTGYSEVWFADDAAQSQGRVRYEHSVDRMEFWTANVERVWLTSAGFGVYDMPLTVQRDDAGELLDLYAYGYTPNVDILRSAGNMASPTATPAWAASNIRFQYHDDSSFSVGAQISGVTEEAWTDDSTDQHGARLQFATRATGASESLTMRWYISAAGDLVPNGNNNYDIGTSSWRVADFYTNAIYSTSNIECGFTLGSLGQRIEPGDATTTTLRFDADNWRIWAGGGSAAVLNLAQTGVLTCYNDVKPGSDSSYDIGATGAVWAEGWFDALRADTDLTLNPTEDIVLQRGGTNVAETTSATVWQFNKSCEVHLGGGFQAEVGGLNLTRHPIWENLFKAAESVTKGYVVRLADHATHGSSWHNCSAADLDTKTPQLIGIAMEAGSAGNTMKVCVAGFFSYSTYSFGSANTGAALYVPSSDGVPTITAPTSAGEVVQVVGHVTGDTELLVAPQYIGENN